MSRDSPSMDEIYGVGAEAADAQAQDESEFAEAVAGRVVLHVCELPDYTSPDDQPDLVMCTVQELKDCVLRAFEEQWNLRALGLESAPSAGLKP